MRYRLSWAPILLGVWLSIPATAAEPEVSQAKRAVIELFTSQGCSSCPPADTLAGHLTADPSLLVLSFHVNYWDHLGWKDLYASQSSSDRQYAYERALGEHSAFTPQIIVNGALSVVGSREHEVMRGVWASSKSGFPVHAELARRSDAGFQLTLTGEAAHAEVWEIRYVRHASTPIRGGENRGLTLATFNNVTHIRRVSPFNRGTQTLSALQAPDDGLAILVQGENSGVILGATDYETQH